MLCVLSAGFLNILMTSLQCAGVKKDLKYNMLPGLSVITENCEMPTLTRDHFLFSVTSQPLVFF